MLGDMGDAGTQLPWLPRNRNKQDRERKSFVWLLPPNILRRILLMMTVYSAERVMSNKSAMDSPQPQPDSWGNIRTISAEEFSQFKVWIHGVAGINLAEHKQALVMGRLQSRLRHYQLGSYGEYFRLLTSGKYPSEQQIAIDYLTTNETYFFREPKHFDYLASRFFLRTRHRSMRVWSAAALPGKRHTASP